MTSSIAAPLSMVQTLIAAQRASGVTVTPQLISDGVDRVLGAFPDLASTENRGLMIAELEARFSVWVGEARTLDDDTDHVAWLPARKDEIDWRHWDRYSTWLDQEISLFARQRLDDVTSDILGRLEDPRRSGRWSRRGLVVGHVQSGKTANYIGLINKAADAGYKLIVVLSGMHRNLRTQTQIRLDEGFLGYDSRPNSSEDGGVRALGVGSINPSVRPNSITNRRDNGDFSLTVARNFNIAPGGTPLLFVVKKNGSVLKNLLDWVRQTANSTDPDSGRPLVVDVPLLVIDDEADQSSVDTGRLTRLDDGTFDPEYDPKPINSRIRSLLQCFAQNAYVGYTATPFANIFIHEQARTAEEGEDLFPRSFIMNLPAPSNYYGPSELFPARTSTDDDLAEASASRARAAVFRHVVDQVDDAKLDPRIGWMPPHNKDHRPRHRGRDEVPPSLREAIAAFVLASAARTARGQGREHKTMLVHVTRFTDVQRAVYSQVVGAKDRLKALWRNDDVAIRRELRELWERDFLEVSDESTEAGAVAHPWVDIEPHVWSVLDSLSVKEINGTSADVLAYEEHKEIGLNVIVIGGDKLSRGLTLSGLTVSYFLRSSRMYDTLMQMGRWFGYRPGYADLCRLYLTPELVGWFRDIAQASEELREQFDHMVAVGMSPRDYGLKVMTHPSLMVTSAVKCRESAVLQIKYAGAVSETVSFLPGQRLQNENALRALLTDIGEPISDDAARVAFPKSTGSAHLWADVDGDLVVRFLRAYATPPTAYRANGELLAKYIAAQRGIGELEVWTIALVAPRGGAPAMLAGRDLRLSERKDESIPADGSAYRIGRLLSPTDELIDLSTVQFDRALAASRAAFTADPGRYRRKTPPDIPSGPAVRAERSSQRGLLLLYALNPDTAPSIEERVVPYLGVGISFPGSLRASSVQYKVNNVFLERDFFTDS